MSSALAFLCSALVAAAPAATRARVVIDPGHGGAQEGAISPDGQLEKTVSLDVARRLKAALEHAGADAVLTREQDVLLALADRVTFANKGKPDVFVSLHLNSMPTRRLRAKLEGVQTFFLSASASGEDARRVAETENADSAGAGAPQPTDTLAFILSDLRRSEAHADSARLAYAIHSRLVAASGGSDHGVQQAPFYVLTGVEAPAVLVEFGFISHPEESKKLAKPEYRDRIAQSIADGVLAFLTQTAARDRRPPVASSTAP
ncbi:MAG TPA: N-acetylmuramoyl-L-alanine amidase [Myxococcaceae bacterium]|nr:N-acetylmuramoyl-L-alanine amidase [Myxococcaceae bacterium]